MAYKQKIIFILLGIITIPVLLEITLTSAGLIYKRYRINNYNKVIESRDGFVRVLCLGDSFTFGIGAPKGYSYPEQLQKILDNNSNKKYIVYNMGIGGQNSSQLLKNLEKNIQKFHPDVILIMTGINNDSNFAGSNYFLFKDRSFRTSLYRLDAFLSNAKSYRLLKFFLLTIIQRTKHDGNMYRGAESFKSQPPKEISGEVTDILIKKGEEYKKVAKFYEAQFKIGLAIDEYKKAIELNPYDDNAYYLLGSIYLHRCQDMDKRARLLLAVDSFKESVRINPSNESVREDLYAAYYRLGENKKAVEELKAIHSLNPKNEMVNALLIYGLPAYQDMGVFKMMLVDDLDNIITLLYSKKIRLMLVSYPESWPNDILREVAGRSRIPFINNQSVFEQKLSIRGNRREDFFAEDGHCNADGYKIIAENICKILDE